MNILPKLLIAFALLSSLASGAFAQPVSKEQIKSLDEQVQDIKKDVLAISSELLQLEEKLLYPSNTQVSVFFSLPASTKIRVDSVKVTLDGKEAAHHIYTFKELEALKRGGIQRIHTGNVQTGEHSIEVSILGKTAGDANYQQSANYKFKKSVEPKLIEIQFDGGTAIQFRE